MKAIIKPNQNNPESKKNQVTHMFNGISKSYDLLNRIITLGIDILWRRRVVNILRKQAPKTILDIATGTGDLVIALSKLETERIIGLDISPGMLDIGKKKVNDYNLDNRIDMHLGDCELLKYKNNTFDAITVAFGVRNFENLDKGLEEILRVLKSKGSLVILETAVPKNIILKGLYKIYTQTFLPVIGKIFSKDASAYKYLSNSAEVFPCGEAFNNILKKNGFIEIEDIPQTLGVASIYIAKKP